MEILLQVSGEHAVDRIVDDEAARHPQAGRQGVAENTGAEDLEQRSAKLLVLLALQTAILLPHLGLLDIDANPNDGERRQNAEYQQAAPANHIIEQPVRCAGEQESNAP